MTSRTFALLAALACSVLAPQDKQALARLRRAFDSSKKTRDSFEARKRALARLRGVDSAAAVRALLNGYRVLDAEAGDAARERARVLVEGTSLELTRFRKKLDPIHELQELVLARLGAMESEAASRAMLEALAREYELPQLLAIRLAAGAAVAPSPTALKKALARELDTVQRIGLLRVVRSLGPRGRLFAKWVLKRLAEKSPTVVLEAAHTLGALRATEAALPLVDRIEQHTGRVRAAILRALELLTGQKLGASPDVWRAWLAKKPAAAPRTGTAASPRGEMPTYFGIPQDGAAILYVLDRSDSMRRQMKKGGQRLEHARRELSKAIAGLPPTTRFNIVAFSIKIKPWSEQLEPATKKNIARAKEWLRSLTPEAGTSSYDALERGFRIAGARSDDRYGEVEIETVFFLSDGEPTIRTGGFTQPLKRDRIHRVLGAVRRWNAIDRAVVHTIGLGLARAEAREFMAQLAAQNRGRFVGFR